MVTAETPRGRLHVLMNRVAPILPDMHWMAPFVLMQMQGAIDNTSDERIIELCRCLRDITTFIIAGGEPPAWLP